MFAAIKTLYLNWQDLEVAERLGFEIERFNARVEGHMTVVEFDTIEERAAWQGKISDAIWRPDAENKA